jgi:hypothetical protein
MNKLGTENIQEIYDGEPISTSPFLFPSADELWLWGPGFAWNETSKPVINNHFNQELKHITRVADGIYNIHYKESPLSQLIQKPYNIVNRKIKNYLKSSLEDLWNIDAEPFSNIVASYMSPAVWTHYLDWAYYWIKQGRNIENLDLILEYVFEMDEITLLKLPSYAAVEQDDWKVTPIIYANGAVIDANNFTKKEPLLTCAVPYTELQIRQEIIKRNGRNNIVTSLTPKIFYSSVFCEGKLMANSARSRNMVRNRWIYSSLDKIITEGGVVCSYNLKHDSQTYEPSLDDFEYCQLCERETVVCSVCNFRDLLFCHIHSGIIKCRECKSTTISTPYLCIKCDIGPSRAL